MARQASAAPVRQVLLKLHSRCNLSCTYCYVYHHVDQRWRSQPRAMSRETVDLAAHRIGEHARTHQLSRVTVILHGGEPLLAGAELIDYVATAVAGAVPAHTAVAIHVQTNGLLLDESFLEVFRRHNILVGISLDGDAQANDLNRRYANGSGSYDGVSRALRLLRDRRYRSLYSGLLCTIDVRNHPLAVYDGLLEFAPPRLDFLLPHGNWTSPPPNYDPDGHLTPYADWLIAVFDRWYERSRPPTDIRLFRSILELLGGGHSASEALGLDPVDLLVVETDGSIEQGDALKTVADGASATGMTLARHTFDDALTHPGIRARQLGLDALAPQCRACPVVGVCGGGLYAHRYRAGAGFANPTVYCRDQLKLINHIRDRRDARLRTLYGAGRPVRSADAAAASRPVQPPAYRFTARQFDELAAGYGDESTMELLRSSQASKRRLLLHAVIRAAVDSPEWTEWNLAESWALLQSAATAGGQTVADEVLHHPFVDAWAMRCLAALRRGTAADTPPRADLAYLPALATAAALRGGVSFHLAVPLPAGRLNLPGIGLADGLGPGIAKVAGDGELLTIAGPDRTVQVPAPYTVDAPWWYPRRLVTVDSPAGRLAVAIEDLDAYRSCFSLPLADRLSGPALRALADALASAWQVIGSHHPRYALAMRVGLRALVPLQPPERGAVSAAARRAFGALATSTPPPGTDLALLLIHETQHMKLGAVLDLVDLYDRADTTLHHAPWRADPRPVGALLQGVYAHAGVADYWRVRRALEPGEAARAAELEFTHWLEQTRRAAGTLMRSGSLTEHGERFVARLIDTLESWRGEAIGSDIAAGASDIVRAGAVRWRLANLRPSTAEVHRIAEARRDGAPCPRIAGVPAAEPATPSPAVLDGLAGRIRAGLIGDGTRAPSRAEEDAYLAGDFAGASLRYRAAVAAAPHLLEPWIGLALSSRRDGARPGSRILTERPDLVRAVYLALDGRESAPDELAGWLADGLDPAPDPGAPTDAATGTPAPPPGTTAAGVPAG
jgi:uncharacterized protein